MLEAITPSFLEYAFMQRAFIAGILIAIACGIIGPFLVLRRLSLVGDGLAHFAFGGIALGLLFGIAPMLAALVTVIIGIFLIRYLLKKDLPGDAAIAVVLALGVGSGIILIGLSQGFTTDIFSYLIGSILSLNSLDIIIIAILSTLVVFGVLFFYKELTYLSFSEQMAHLRIKNLEVTKILLDLLIALVIIIGIRAAGILLITVLLVLPALIGLQLAKNLKQTIIISIIASTTAILTGIIISWYANTPPSGTIALLLLSMFAITFLIKK